MKKNNEERAISSMVLNLSEEMAYLTNNHYTGHTIKKKEHSWLLVLRVTDPKGVKWVGFIEAPTHHDCWYLVYRAMHFSDIRIAWKKDRY